MIDLDTFHAALRTPPDEEFRGPDLDGIIAAGGRIRRQRRLAAGILASVSAVALILGGAVAVRFVGRVAVTAPAGSTGAPTPRPGPSSTSVSSDQPLGQVIPTGIADGDGELVFYAVAVDIPRLPGTHFAVMAGRRDSRGHLTAEVAANEVTGSDHAAGFHATSAAIVADGHAVPTFGYYAGPATRITGTVNGRQVTAHQAVWSQDPTVVVFWFTPLDATPSGLAAYNAQGTRLPNGNTTISQG